MLKQTHTHKYTETPNKNSNVNQRTDLTDQISFLLHLQFSFET